ncbi:glycosyltransferase [Lysobacter sp. TAF61]|uniref:glycosyltransferase n=1 Tax=Lysobacter sp. TAF61 TaxID=3233072 RepID=UPI003F9AB3B7
MNGADILILGRWLALSRHCNQVFLVAQDSIYRLGDGRIVHLERFENRNRSKSWAALRTLLRQSHYLYEKFVTPRYQAAVSSVLSGLVQPRLVCSFPSVGIWAADAYSAYCSEASEPCLIETHNDEVKWFREMAASGPNPLSRLVAYCSLRWLRKRLPSVIRSARFIHVASADEQGYEREFGTHDSFVIPVGVEVPAEALSRISGSDVVRLLFIGSLGVKMNLDALRYFASTFEPVIASGLGERLNVCVAGSCPSVEIVRLCEERGWELQSDLTDQGMSNVLARADFTIMPFAYLNGGKLKLLKSLAHGIPVLATSGVQGQLNAALPRSVFSDKPEDWLHECERLLFEPISDSETDQLVRATQPYSWSELARQMLPVMGIG